MLRTTRALLIVASNPSGLFGSSDEGRLGPNGQRRIHAAAAALVEACLDAQVKIGEITAFRVEVAECRTGADQDAVCDMPVA